ncbi:MAG: hypothetical protein LUD27_00950 [Clostridia bacterium]|nr:hypothetical protein [Clostridia bacterium]
MSKKKHLPEPIEKEPVTTKAYIYAGIECEALGAELYGNMITDIKIYGLITGIVFEIAGLGFCRTQKNKNPVKFGKYVNIAGYILLIAGVVFMIAGVIYGALN